MRTNAIKSKRGTAIISKINGIYEQVGESVRGHKNAIADAKSSMNTLKAAASNTQDIVRSTNYTNLANEKRKEIITLKTRLDDMLDEAMPNAGELMDELTAARDEEAKANAEELVKYLKIVSNLLAEQCSRDTAYMRTADLMRTTLASTKIKEELQSKTRLNNIDTSLHDNKYSRSQAIIGNMISTFLNEC